MAERPLFDPSRIRPAPADEGRPGVPSLLSVRELNELVRGAINRHVPPTVHVVGEIGDFSRPGSGHLYFTLKDAASEVRCVMWRSSAAAMKFTPVAGMEVIATGGVELYLPRGTYQLAVRRLEPRGIGALEVAFRQLREKLEREGLFEAGRKRPLPAFPRRIAIVTSPSGAALHDIIQTLQRRFPSLAILLFPVRVQGEGAADEIAASIRLMNAHADALGGIDVAIVGRGGGSIEDLWAFNEEIVARAIVASRIPIISAVGHETDVTISDLVADVRAATPTAAAELVAPRHTDLLDRLDERLGRISRAARANLAIARSRLNELTAYDGLARPLARFRERAQQIDENLHRIRHVMASQLREGRARLSRIDLVLQRVSSGAHAVRMGGDLARRLHRVQRAVERLIWLSERQLAERQAHLQQAGPSRRVDRADEHLKQASLRLRSAAARACARKRELLEHRLDALRACDPRSILRRGYSITRDAKSRRVLKSIEQVRAGKRLLTELADGQVHSTADDPRQPGLFDS